MKIITIASLLLTCIAFSADAGGKAAWIVMKNSALFEGLPVKPMPRDDYSAYYSGGVAFGGNITEYFGIQYSLSAVPSSRGKEHTDILNDFIFLLQRRIGEASSGIRPYIGIGYGSKFAFGGTGILCGYGIAAQAGVRYFYDNFLIGIGSDYNYYFYTYNSERSGGTGNHGTIKASAEIGFVF